MKKSNLSSVRIIGGELRSRKINFPELLGLRPTADRIRETLFNWLQFDIAGSHCLDLFSGSGALGLESLSRGASTVTLVEKNQVAAKAIQSNLQELNLAGDVICLDALTWLEGYDNAQGKFDIVYLDPPFGETLIPAVCQKLEEKNMLYPNCKIYIEVASDNSELSYPPHWQETKKKKAGNVSYRLLEVGSKP
ncbi:MAG: 16S rRNA (guanine(966)-N(2))-methyltransferase RsmD [Pseudohongiellaceae bacterium]